MKSHTVILLPVKIAGIKIAEFQKQLTKKFKKYKPKNDNKMKNRFKIIALIFWVFIVAAVGLFLCPFWLILWGITGWSYILFFETQNEYVTKLFETLKN